MDFLYFYSNVTEILVDIKIALAQSGNGLMPSCKSLDFCRNYTTVNWWKRPSVQHMKNKLFLVM